jgi:hypothetical protein
VSSSAANTAPKPRQLAYLRALAEQTETSFIAPKTRRQASAEIKRLLKLKDATKVPVDAEEQLEEQPEVPDEQLLYATAAHPSEVSGFGSSAHWRTSAQLEPETLPQKGQR